ncbi:pyruvate, phosphate dikinase [Listeria welshimeri]|uniref:Pyruvate, phosphate dikinase n=1 Tax=Listeria welshimeri serovar 6b (strain ATCC 35897 / DSM 20650 / CCUG 15529 / CIP 8149 / NCTC 11857 / SLCC 5334 / V8) TaxID=386043 RepID=A0AJX2_LISW6|nr:pyruvate, phosphate dikinase [Listeria welshimeri]MBC1355053.1 pyruvate, phosphate dikinase [Listeria welshimeri]MBC1451678.1 pyruvate, phosphate dikinase [Listeria welshimeri]MBC1767765.1 pyruvate, phosphate dikinase [Listeria welshimeri]MBC1784919.1 pyruvate, phosphate dikinase [Listeria welshimeri]CAK21304.1 pyruvate, phosphate dikinase [Listeria welshimeri serovar 6b str. SLCC5334]
MRKFVYQFSEGSKDMKNLLGGKGANLAEMTNIGLPVPPGFIISTDACNDYTTGNKHLSEEIFEEVKIHLSKLETQTGKVFGSTENPLLVSVRSGAPFSMPGMMDTVLNLGLNDSAARGLADLTGDARSAYDSYRRFIQMFGDVVFEIPSYQFEQALSRIKKANNYLLDTELTADDLTELIDAYKLIFSQATGNDFPQNPLEQLRLAIIAVFDSWMNPRAVIYRRLHDIDASLGTAVNIQAMVFGNTGESSGTGITFTRNPSTGEKEVFGEFLLNAQGEDVVAGIRTPEPISALQMRMPMVYNELLKTCELLENHYLDMQDIEFTIEKGKLYVLQTRSGKRTAKAAIQTAVDFVHEGKITREEAIMRVETKQLHQLLHPAFHESALKNGHVIASGLPASPGAATGQIYFEAKEAVQAAERGISVILVRNETSPEDIEGMARSNAILTAHGGMTSHAAVVARGMGKCCIAGCSELTINEKEKTITLKTGEKLYEGDYLSLDGSSGNIYLGEIALTEASIGGHFDELMGWADAAKKLMIRVNADTPTDFKKALLFGAEGIGLCRTEHMFFDEKRIPYVRQMILAESLKERESVLTILKEMQKADFSELFRIAEGRSVNIRLLDPPLHEFLPKTDHEIEQLAQDMNRTVPQIRKRIEALAEANPMLGHRGCRLAITFPEIYRMQAEAIMESAVIVHDEGISVHPEIMIPLIATKSELSYIKKEIKQVIHAIFDRERMVLPYDIGTMIEIPRACVTADEIAEEAQFFSFGTNDLTQLTYGFSRDDATKFLADYYEKDILAKDPFMTIDKAGVGALVEMAVTRGRMTHEHLKMGVCGEHGGDPDSIQFFHQLGLTYVSCSPYRVPIARLAAAQAALGTKQLVATL